MNISPSTQWSFRPAQMPEEMFVKTFVGREKELNMLFSHISFNLIPSAITENKKNLLIKSERGIGKTSLFLAVKYQLKRQQAHMLKKIIPVFFNEQEDFNTTEKLILRMFEIILGDTDTMAWESLSHPQEWEKSFREIKSNIKNSLKILKHNLALEEKKLVFFIENFDSVVYRVLRKKGKKKSGELGSEDIFISLVKDPDILLICSALEDPQTPHEYGKETFKIIELKPLEDFYQMIIQRARYDNNLFLLSNKEKLQNKIKAFDYLTGGNTRLMVHLYECLVEKDINKLEFLLNDMINKSTPLFEWIIQKFVDYESREILNTIARRGGNATVKEVAEDTFNSENSVRVLLNRLREKKFVEKINEKRDKSDIYIMVPMMFFIWYQKSVLQRKDIILDFFIHFVDLFFDPTELADNKRIEQVHQLKIGDKDEFAPYFNFIKEYIEAGKFPLKSSDEKRKEEPQERDVGDEKMIYEVVRARENDTILQQQVHKALSLKAEKKLSESANLFRIAARGYLILAEETGKSFADPAEENIRRAIEMYQTLKTEPLETVRCLLILVEILSDTERKEEVKLFAQTMIRIGKKQESAEFKTYLGHAYKYLGFVETETEKRLELFNTALVYFEKDTEQTIVTLVNIGLVYRAQNKYETALDYFEKALGLIQNQEYSIYLSRIIPLIMSVYMEAEDFRGGLQRLDEILVWLENERYEGNDFGLLYYIKALFLMNNAEFWEAEKYLLKSIEIDKKKDNPFGMVFSLMISYQINLKLNKKQKAEERLKDIHEIIKKCSGLSHSALHKLADSLLVTEYFDQALSVYKKLYMQYQTLNNAEGQAGSLLNIGNCYYEIGDLKTAEESYTEAIKIAHSNNLKEILAKANINYAKLLFVGENYQEAISILEDLIQEDSSNEVTQKTIFLVYMRKCLELYNEKDFDNALSYVRKSLKYIGHLSVKDFVRGFYFDLVMNLIEKYGKDTYPFFKEMDLYLSEYYEDKEKGDYIKFFNPVIRLVKGEDFYRLAKDMTPELMELLRLINQKLHKDNVLEEVARLVENKELAKAVGMLEKSLEEDKENIKKLKELVRLYKGLSRNEKYFELLKQIVGLSPDDMEIGFELYDYWRNIGNKEEVEKTLIALLEKNPKNAGVLFGLGCIAKDKKNYQGAIEYMDKAIKNSLPGSLKEGKKIFLANIYLLADSPSSLKEAGNLLETVKVDKLFGSFYSVYVFYFFYLVVLILNKNREKFKHTLTSLMYILKDSSINPYSGSSDTDLNEVLKRKLKQQEFECIENLDRMVENKAPISFFTKQFCDFFDAKMADTINEELQHSGSNIFERIIDENIIEMEQIVTLCGTRLKFEGLLYHIKEKFPDLTGKQQDHMVSLLVQVLEKLPESYKWLVLDFCSQHLINLPEKFQTNLVNSLLQLLEEKKTSDYFLKETRAFLHTAKSMLEQPLKEKIEKTLIGLKHEVKK